MPWIRIIVIFRIGDSLGTFRSPEYELRVTSSLSALAAFVSGRFVSCLRASAGFLVGKYERRKSFLNASKVSSSYFSCISYPLNMSGIPCWHCSRRDRNDFHVNLAAIKMGLKKIKNLHHVDSLTQ
jgi:hypothetical protein